MKKIDPLMDLSVDRIMDEPMIPISKVKEISKKYEETIHKLMDLLESSGKTTDQWGSAIDSIGSTNLNQASIYLLDYENIGNFPALLHTWTKPSDIIYCFMNKTQVVHFDHELTRLEPSLSKRIHPIVLSTSGLNALDIAIGMFIGYITARYQPNGIFVYTNDRGYTVLMEICRFWGIHNIEIRQAISVPEHPKPKIKPIVQSPLKPANRSLVESGKPITRIKRKSSSDEKKKQVEALMQCIKEEEWSNQSMPYDEFIERLLNMFPKSKPQDIQKLIARGITYGFLVAKKGKLALDPSMIEINHAMVEPSL